MKKCYKGDIEKQTLKNDQYRKILYTNKYQQLVLMSIKPKEEIGWETHRSTSQFIRVEKGKGVAYIGKSKYKLKDGVAVIIPPNTKHNVVNTSKSSKLKLYTIYSPPEH